MYMGFLVYKKRIVYIRYKINPIGNQKLEVQFSAHLTGRSNAYRDIGLHCKSLHDSLKYSEYLTVRQNIIDLIQSAYKNLENTQLYH